jgi:hypothetical protein
MSRDEKFLFRLLSGKADGNIDFSELRSFLERRGFRCRIRGDHFIYTHPKVDEIVNIQPAGVHAKPYQVRQIRSILIKYGLALEE